jgi:hypothetical protein
MLLVSRMRQNLMFSFPQLTSLQLSIGLNFKAKMLKSEVYFAAISGFSPFCILLMSQITISSLLWLSFPTLARNRPSGLKETHFMLVTGIVTIDKHRAV